jgi:hypothetical protein
VSAALVVGRAERALLHRAAVRDLASIGDIELALRRGDGATARALRGEFEPVLALLDDLGWEADDPREAFVVTLDRAALRACVGRWLDEVEGSLTAASCALTEGAARWQPAIRAAVDADLDLRGACLALLDAPE